jgi:hypothetical protein
MLFFNLFIKISRKGSGSSGDFFCKIRLRRNHINAPCPPPSLPYLHISPLTTLIGIEHMIFAIIPMMLIVSAIIWIHNLYIIKKRYVFAKKHRRSIRHYFMNNEIEINRVLDGLSSQGIVDLEILPFVDSDKRILYRLLLDICVKLKFISEDDAINIVEYTLKKGFRHSTNFPMENKLI